MDIEELFSVLAEDWNDVYMVRRSHTYHKDTEKRYCVRNHTDEGLGVNGEEKSAYGVTLREALVNAVEGDFSDVWDEMDG